MNFMNFLAEDSSSQIPGKTVVLKVFDEDLSNTPNHEIFTTLQDMHKSGKIISFKLADGSINTILVVTDIDLIEDMHLFSSDVTEPLRELGYDIRLVNVI